MKKTIYIIAILSLFGCHFSVLHAQTEVWGDDNDHHQTVSMGLLGGPNVSAFIMRVGP